MTVRKKSIKYLVRNVIFRNFAKVMCVIDMD